MNQMRILFWVGALLCLLCGSGCSCQRSASGWDGYSPAIKVVVAEPSGPERVFFSKLSFEALKYGLAVDNASCSFSTLEKRRISLRLNYKPVKRKAGHATMEMVVVCDGKESKVPSFTCDLREDPVVAEGEGWRVQLLGHYQEDTSQKVIPGEKLDWDAMKAEFERTGKEPSELILKQ